MSQRFDVGVVGAGLIGLALARALAAELRGVSIVVIDKEDRIAAHQSSHNSGVVHSGLYYRPGSLKARLCVEGREALYALCASAGIEHRRSGKLVLATRDEELPRLAELERRGRANGLIGLRRLSPDEIREIEPAARGAEGLAVPDTGVADFPAVAAHLAAELRAAGGTLLTGAAVVGISLDAGGVRVRAGDDEIALHALVNCAGLHSDRIAAIAGIEPPVRIVPFRGEYYRLRPAAAQLVRTLIYPVPDPRFPFLGVHFTRRVDGTVEVGPNAVLAIGREHYQGARLDWGELRSVLGYRGFRRLVGRHWLAGAREIANSRSRRRYAALARRLVPEVSHRDLLAGGVGVRAQAVDRHGNLVDDFVIEAAGRSIHVLNAPSPGATACLAIGRHIASQVKPILSG